MPSPNSPSPTLAPPSTSYVCRRATTPEELHAIARFRYSIYVEAMGRRQRHADHRRKTVSEPLDATSHVLAAFDEAGHIAGTLRMTLGAESDFSEYESLYRCPDFGVPHRVLSVTTKLMVRPELRGTTAGASLVRAAFRLAWDSGVEFDLMDCNEPLVRYFERHGYVRHGAPVVHPEYGEVQPMALRIRDLDHLRAVRSPFLDAIADAVPPTR